MFWKQTPASYNVPKLGETYKADEHTLVKFFRNRIPCSCLDEKYEEMKNIAKMGLCCNPDCNVPEGRVERSKTMYCSQCRNATYCSRECQIADWTSHKSGCATSIAYCSELRSLRPKRRLSTHNIIQTFSIRCIHCLHLIKK